MRDWLGKPLLIVAAILLVLGGISIYWLKAGPSPAGADVQTATTNTYHQQVQQAIEDCENGR